MRWWCIIMHALMHALMHAWIRMRYSLRKYACDTVCVFVKSVKSAKPLLPNPNDHYRFQMIILVKTWFKSVSQLIVSSGINSLDLADEIFCWWKRILLLKIRRRAKVISGNYRGNTAIESTSYGAYDIGEVLPSGEAGAVNYSYGGGCLILTSQFKCSSGFKGNIKWCNMNCML